MTSVPQPAPSAVFAGTLAAPLADQLESEFAEILRRAAAAVPENVEVPTKYVALQAKPLARATQVFDVPVMLSTIGVRLRSDEPTLRSIREEIPDVPELNRTTMNAWEEVGVLEAGRHDRSASPDLPAS